MGHLRLALCEVAVAGLSDSSDRRIWKPTTHKATQIGKSALAAIVHFLSMVMNRSKLLYRSCLFIFRGMSKNFVNGKLAVMDSDANKQYSNMVSLPDWYYKQLCCSFQRARSKTQGFRVSLNYLHIKVHHKWS